MRQMLHGEKNGKEIGIYGLGEKRTLKDFERISGINFAQRELSDRAKQGVFEVEA